MADRALSNHSAVMSGQPLSWCVCFCLWMRSERPLGSLFMSCFNLEARCCKAESANLRMSCGPSDQGESQGMLSILTGLRSKMEGTPKLLNVAKRDGDVAHRRCFGGPGPIRLRIGDGRAPVWHTPCREDREIKNGMAYTVMPSVHVRD